MALAAVPAPSQCGLCTEGFSCVTSYSVYSHPCKRAFSSSSLGETMFEGWEGGWCGRGSVWGTER